MSYLEHRLILAFFECGLSYNTIDAFPKFAEMTTTTTISTETQLVRTRYENTMLSRVKSPNQAKPFKVREFYFLNKTHYEKFRKSLNLERKKQFLSLPQLRAKLVEKSDNLTADVRYLTPSEIQEVHEQNLFFQL